MNLSDRDLVTLAGQAMDAARAAGKLIAKHRQAKIEVEHKEAGTSAASQVVTEVDRIAQTAILELLEPSCREYDLALLTEESPDDGERHQKPAFWCIDPMDGTLAFVKGIPGFAVSIALVSRDGSPLIGVVYDPVGQTLYHAIRGQGAFKDGAPMEIPALDPGRPLVLRTDFSFQSHPWREQTRSGLEEIAHRLGLDGADIRFRIGGVMNACTILEDPNTCYFKYPRTGDSGGSLWDFAATACLYREAGAVASDINGKPMELNRPGSTFMNHRGVLYAAHQAVAEQVIALAHALTANNG
ncbi:MAG: inositol monophosphatase family protein [Sedimenticola sp.]